MNFTEAQLIQMVLHYMWPFIRVSAMLIALPTISGQSVPTSVRLILALAITMGIAPSLPAIPFYDPFTAVGVVVLLQQVLIGITMGFILYVVYGLFSVAGHVLSMQIGLGFAMLADPQTGVSVPSISRLLTIAVTLLFFVMNGHLILIDLLSGSFTTIPIGPTGLPALTFLELVKWSGWIFKGAVLIALPVIVALLILNLSFGVLSRVAPQLNIMSVGFPFTLNFGLLIIALGMSVVLAHVNIYLAMGFKHVAMIVGQ